MKNELLQLQLIKESYIKKLAQIENKIKQLEDSNYEHTIS